MQLQEQADRWFTKGMAVSSSSLTPLDHYYVAICEVRTYKKASEDFRTVQRIVSGIEITIHSHMKAQVLLTA
jgi:hypothetical protein